ncbi:MAG: carbamoyltransferase HypF [Betaproteobacteria bacterium]|nr:carbamoyltransferase HypF [Betaproteobacteria bacterium]
MDAFTHSAVFQVRRRIRVRGQVQGVGFRPFVYRLATELALSGWVRNDAEGVEAEIQGAEPRIAELLARLKREAPPLARIESVEHQARPVEANDAAFFIAKSGSGRAATGIAPDTAVCEACLAELFDPAGRRYRYPFINCTHCGPRYSITRALPYDRPHTSMAPFTQCPACQAEYDAPENRRFHAQPNACPACGPRLELLDAQGSPIPVADPIAETVARLLRSEIVTLKGLGGFHLACDARNAEAVARLRARKQRDEKPFAVMVAGPASLEGFAVPTGAELALLASPERPIVLLQKATGGDAALPGIAPGLASLGAMLPYTPLQYLLFHEAAGRPAGLDWLSAPQGLVLVMTSANPGGEPLVIGNDEALERLSGIADVFLLHDRDILVRCDDSVLRIADRGDMAGARDAIRPTRSAQFIRRARGYTPRAIRLPGSGPATLAVGGYFKNTVCLTRGDEAFLSQHIGSLDNAATCAALDEAVEHLMAVLEIEPARVAHDLHPDFYSTRFGVEFARERGIPCVAVQHHHAHIAAVAAEYGVRGPVLGLALDGVGLGEDGTAWGGELLKIEGPRFTRLGHLKTLPLPGGDRAAREPWRMASAVLHGAGRADEIEARFPGAAAPVLRQMLEQRVNCPETSSGGRQFDAAAGLLGVKAHSSFEGQAAMLLEGLAAAHGPVEPLAGSYRIGEGNALDLLPLLSHLADCGDAGYGAALFHATLAKALAEWVLHACYRENVFRVALSGGCFLNRVLSASLRQRLKQEGIEVLEAGEIPPNDGGLSLGQAWVAMQTRQET